MRLLALKVTERELQDKLNDNEGGYPSQINDLRRDIRHEGPAHPRSGQPPGTKSVLYQYWDGPRVVMMLHCFIKPDGTLGASGKMDPKRLLVNGIYYYT